VQLSIISNQKLNKNIFKIAHNAASEKFVYKLPSRSQRTGYSADMNLENIHLVIYMITTHFLIFFIRKI